MTRPLVSNVSDTARWVAACRAFESARPDALFHDPLANKLAGTQGHAIAGSARRVMGRDWPMVTRTKLMDDMIYAAIAAGCTCVANLAAGLDTRPYRMKLPANLTWIEADLAPLLDEKAKQLDGETPVCKLVRKPVDLSDAAALTSLLATTVPADSKALVLTEGLLVYLDESSVRAMSGVLHACSNVRWWVMDLVSPSLATMMNRQMPEEFANAPLKFASHLGVAYFEPLGWKLTDVRSMLHEARRFKRLPPFLHLISFLPPPNPRKPGRSPWSAVAQYERS